ncbi:MAG: hypothetical protein VKM34_02885 [Cyanobacteriota bacterium]|nr:hypothetical protein [Cyanobacteriota bacterium]
MLTVCDHGNYGETSTEPQWWSIGGHVQGSEDELLHPVVALVGELTGGPIRDDRCPHHRPAMPWER